MDFLTVNKPAIATFYLSPKIHKDALNPLGRPIVASIGSFCKVFIWITFTTFRFTTSFIFIGFYTSHSTTGESSFLKEHLYGYMCYQYRLTLLKYCAWRWDKAVTYFLHLSDPEDNMSKSFLIDLLDFVICHNYFVSNRPFSSGFLDQDGCTLHAFLYIFYTYLSVGGRTNTWTHHMSLRNISLAGIDLLATLFFSNAQILYRCTWGPYISIFWSLMHCASIWSLHKVP